MSKRRDSQLEFLQRALDATMLKPSRLAEVCGITPSTLTKFLNGQSEELRDSTISKIATFSQTEAPQRPGFSEADAIPFLGTLPEPMAVPEISDRFRMVMKTDVLEDLHILSGDILTFDRSIDPMDGNVVIAQVYDRRQATAETLVRQFSRGVLLGRSQKLVEPIPISEGTAVMMGVLVNQLRNRDWRANP